MTEVRVLKMFVNGEFEEHYNHEYLKVLNPSTEEVIAKIPAGTVKMLTALLTRLISHKSHGKNYQQLNVVHI